MIPEDSKDFIASELLSELKASNERKDKQLVQLHKNNVKIIFAFIVALLLLVAGFLWYLNQYDFSSTSTVQKSAEGVYAVIDSDGNAVAWDIDSDEMIRILEVIDDGEN